MAFKFGLASLGLVAFINLMPPVMGAGGYLRASSSVEIDKRFLLELAGAFTNTDASSQIEQWKNRMATIVNALPKDADGRVQHDVVQYALHRAFLHQKSWNIRGLNPNSENTKVDPISLSTIQGRPDISSVPFLPTMLQKAIEQRHIGVGLNVDEIAALAASIQDLTHLQSLNRLRMAYEVQDLSVDSMLTMPEVDRLMATYITMFMFGGEFPDWTHKTIAADVKILINSGRYQEVKAWMDGALPKMPEQDQTRASFSDLDRYVQAFDNNFGSFSQRECKILKSVLLDREGRKPGRVRISDFYNRSIIQNGSWWLGEKVEYLRTLGALDETNTSNLQVIIANYVTSPTQCFQAMTAYDVCCHNECEDLMGKIENFVGAPEAQHDLLADFVATLETDTVKPQGRLSETVREQLLAIAQDRGGLVALHSRNFALWMHQVFPRECPFPHKQGTTSPLTPDEWIQSTGQSSQLASKEEMEEYIRPDDTCSADCEHQTDDLLDLPWEFGATLPDQVPDAPALDDSESLSFLLAWQSRFIALAAFTLASFSFMSKVKKRKTDTLVF